MIALVLGGAASGKSVIAERTAARLPPPVTYVATWVGEDAEMARRVAEHRNRRPADWATLEAAPESLVNVLASVPGTVLVDALGTWVAGCRDFAVDADALAHALVTRKGDAVVVSDEVSLGVHPSSEAGRHFRDSLGALNQAVAGVADHVWLVVAGRVLPLGTQEGLGWP